MIIWSDKLYNPYSGAPALVSILPPRSRSRKKPAEWIPSPTTNWTRCVGLMKTAEQAAIQDPIRLRNIPSDRRFRYCCAVGLAAINTRWEQHES